MSIECDLFHVSPTRFEALCLDRATNFLLEHGDEKNKSPNGSMGLWISPYPSLCDSFGPEVAKLQLSRNTRYARMDLKQLYALYVQGADFPYREQVLAHQRLGRMIAERCDVLLINDATEMAGEIIVLNLNVIQNWRWLDRYEFHREMELSTELYTIECDHKFSRELKNYRLDLGLSAHQQGQHSPE